MMNPLALKQDQNNNKNDWCTPPWLFKRLNEVFNFEVDGAATKLNTVCDYFISKETTNLHDRYPVNKKMFINPPFNDTRSFIHHRILSKLVVLLIPFRPETKLFHDWFWPNTTIFVFNKRIQYIHPGTKKEVKGAAFPSCLVFFGDISKYPVEELLDLGIFVKRVINDSN